MALPANKSKFTYRQLYQLSKYAVDSPLRVVALVDLDAFYAQCEMKRLGVPPEQPLAVQQWQSLIAVNYPARERGITRHISGVEAKKLCPDIQLVHVATWKAGDSHWSYSPAPNIVNCKTCLDPYRAESNKIVAVFRSVCPNAQTEKASIDESYLDLSKDVHDQLLQQYEILRLPPPNNDPSENLPLPDFKVLNWSGSHLVANAEEEEGERTEMQIDGLDWDDIAMAIGAGIVKEVRDELFKRLGYTCSAGIANNKMIAKLGSGFKKPNQQSVVRASAVQQFLNSFKFTKIRNLGGKLGTQISEHFKTESLPELLAVSIGQFQSFLPDDTATWVYNIIRGLEFTPVTPQTAIKSMLSTKSFRVPLPSCIADAQSWLKVFASDISSRLNEEGPHRRPKTMSLYFANKASTRSRQISIPAAGMIDSNMVIKLAEGILRAVVDANAWPCIRMGLQVSGFEEREEGNRGIGAFLIKGEQAKLANKRLITGAHPGEGAGEPCGGITRFFSATTTTVTHDGDENEEDYEEADAFLLKGENANKRQLIEGEIYPEEKRKMRKVNTMAGERADNFVHSDETETQCLDCGAVIPRNNEAEHKDWHFAKALAVADAPPRLPPTSPTPAVVAGGSRGGGKRKKIAKKEHKLEKGQRKLKF